jgi:hypothetical protein
MHAVFPDTPRAANFSCVSEDQLLERMIELSLYTEDKL